MPWSDDWDEQLYEEGYQAGQKWVERGFRPEDRRGELRRLRRFSESEDWDELWLDADTAPDKYDIMSMIDPGSENDPQGAAEHWSQILDFRTDSDVDETEFLLGLIEGALGLEPSAEFSDDEDEVQTEDGLESAEGPLQIDENVGKQHRAIQLGDADASPDGE